MLIPHNKHNSLHLLIVQIFRAVLELSLLENLEMETLREIIWPYSYCESNQAEKKKS